MSQLFKTISKTEFKTQILNFLNNLDSQEAIRVIELQDKTVIIPDFLLGDEVEIHIKKVPKLIQFQIVDEGTDKRFLQHKNTICKKEEVTMSDSDGVYTINFENDMYNQNEEFPKVDLSIINHDSNLEYRVNAVGQRIIEVVCKNKTTNELEPGTISVLKNLIVTVEFLKRIDDINNDLN